MRRLYRITGLFTPIAAGVVLARLFPDLAFGLLAIGGVAWPVWWNLRSLARTKPVRPEMAQVAGQLFGVVLAFGLLYALLRGAELRFFVGGCYFAALIGTWVYKIAYRQGVIDTAAEINRRVSAVPRTRPAPYFHRPPRPTSVHVVDVDPGEEP